MLDHNGIYVSRPPVFHYFGLIFKILVNFMLLVATDELSNRSLLNPQSLNLMEYIKLIFVLLCRFGTLEVSLVFEVCGRDIAVVSMLLCEL